ncbi:MAG: RraA family protein [Longimicrobiales bacterium]
MTVQGQVGFRIVTGLPRTPPELVEAFRGRASSDVADAMGRFYAMDPGMVSRTGFPLCGVAVTVNARPGDNLMLHKAMELADHGDVLVVCTNGCTTSAVFGDIMGTTAVAAGLGGVVVDGAIRDVEGLRALGLPTYSRAVTPGACDTDGPGEINVPVSCGSIVVAPGDVIVGDQDGLVVVPRDDAAAVLERLAAVQAGVGKRIAAIRAGELFKPEIDQTLRDRGVLP